jgi:hypothetical protein
MAMLLPGAVPDVRQRLHAEPDIHGNTVHRVTDEIRVNAQPASAVAGEWAW